MIVEGPPAGISLLKAKNGISTTNSPLISDSIILSHSSF